MGRPCWVTCHVVQHGHPIQNCLNFGNIETFNYSYFAKITTRKPKIGILTNMTELYPFLDSKKWYLLFKGILWSRDLLVKTINILLNHKDDILIGNT